MCVERTQYCDEYRHLKDWVLLLRVNTKALDYIWERIIYVLSFIHVSNNENEIEACTLHSVAFYRIEKLYKLLLFFGLFDRGIIITTIGLDMDKH